MRILKNKIKKSLYGKRETVKILHGDDNEGSLTKAKTAVVLDEDYDDEEDSDEERPFVDKIVISMDSDWKSVFDVVILLLVGYSCFTTLYYVAFGLPTNKLHKLWD